MNRWPLRHGTALGMAIMMVLGIGTVALLNARAAGALPIGYAAEGIYVYEGSCAPCHGYEGEGTSVAPALVGDSWATDVLSWDGLADRIDNPTGGMPEFALDRQDMADTIAYLKDLHTYGGT